MRAFIREAFLHMIKSWRHHTGTMLGTLVVLVASLTAVIGITLLSKNLYQVLTLWGESIQMSVYISENSPTLELQKLEDYLKSENQIDKLKFVDQEEALRVFQEQMASYAPDLLADEDLQKMIPSSYQFSIHASVGPERQLSVMTALAQKLKNFAAVEEVNFGQEWIKSYSSITQGLIALGVFFSVIVLLGSAFVISNVISNSISQRRSEIEVLELIGATRSFIRGPYIFEGFFVGVLGASLSLVLSYALFLTLKGSMKTHLAFLQLSNHIHFMSLLWALGFLLAAGLIGAMSAHLCLRKINDGWSAARTLKA